MKRLVIPVVLVAGVIAVIAVNAAAKGKPAGTAGQMIHVIEHATDVREPRVRQKGRSAGR